MYGWERAENGVNLPSRNYQVTIRLTPSSLLSLGSPSATFNFAGHGIALRLLWRRRKLMNGIQSHAIAEVSETLTGLALIFEEREHGFQGGF